MDEKELVDIWLRWRVFFEVFLMIADRQNGNLIHLPFKGTPLKQPYKSFKIIECIQTLYFEKLKEDYEKGVKS